MLEPGYLLAFTTGVFGGFGHCIGMCGPITASCSLAASETLSTTKVRRFLPLLLYNSGRIVTYGCIGGVMGLSGSFVNVAGRLAGIQNVVSFAAGLLMIAMGLGILGAGGGRLERLNAPVLRIAAAFRGSSSPLASFPLGLTLGLLPCGLSYTIFIASAGTGGFVPGMLTSVLFGVGTVPALLSFGALIASLAPALRGRIYRASGVVVVVMGIYFIARGFRLHAAL
jgi:uncharacterized protein